MRKRILQELFCSKITMEINCFKKRMLKRKPEKILANAYRINCMICIYEILMEKSQELESETLKTFLMMPEILALFYEAWMGKSDSFQREMESCIYEVAAEFSGLSRELEKEAA